MLGRQSEGRASQGAEASYKLDLGKGRRQKAGLKIRERGLMGRGFFCLAQGAKEGSQQQRDRLALRFRKSS